MQNDLPFVLRKERHNYNKFNLTIIEALQSKLWRRSLTMFRWEW